MDAVTSPTGLTVLRRSAAPIRAVQIYGQRCSGTHFLIKTIERSFPDADFTEAYGFKHWFVPHHVVIPEGVLVLVVARHAGDWIRSLHARPWHVRRETAALPFADFIRAEWHAVWDDENFGIGPAHPLWGQEMLHERCPATGQRFADPMAMRTAKLAHWAGLARRAPDVALIRYEDVRDRPGTLLNGLRAAFDLPPVTIRPITSYKGHGLKTFTGSAYPPLSPADRAFIHARLNPATESLYGYCYDSPPPHATNAVSSAAASAGPPPRINAS